MDRFAKTVGDDVTVVDGTGTLVHGREGVLQAHGDWFAATDAWTFDYRVRLLRDFGTAGLALIDVTYRQTPGDEPSRFLLSLVFERSQRGAWQFVFDQNTPLPSD